MNNETPISKEIQYLGKISDMEDPLDVLLQIKTFQNKNNLSKVDQLELESLRYRQYIRQGDYKLALEASTHLRILSQHFENQIYELDGISGIIESLHPLGKMEEAYIIQEEGQKIVDLISKDLVPPKLIKLAQFFFISGVLHQMSNIFDKAKEFFNKSLEMQKKDDKSKGIGKCLLHLGNISRDEQDLDTAEKLYFESLSYTTKFENDVHSAWTYHQLSVMGILKGNYSNVLKYSNKCLEIANNLKNAHLQEYCYSNLGVYYTRQGKLSQALEYHKKCLEIREHLGHQREMRYSYQYIGKLYRLMGEITKSVKFFQKILALPNIDADITFAPFFYGEYGKVLGEQGNYNDATIFLEKAILLGIKYENYVTTIANIYFLVCISIFQHDQKKIHENYLLSQKIQSKNPTDEQIHIITLLIKGKVYLNDSKFRKKFAAQTIFMEIINHTYNDEIILKDTCIYLIESLIDEYEISKNPQILYEIIQNTESLKKHAQTQNSFSLLAEILFFQAELSIIQLEFEKARNLLNEGQKVAEREGLGHLASKISHYHDKLLENLVLWEKNPSPKDFIDQLMVPSKNYFEISKSVGNFEKLFKLQTEKPYFITIWSNKGMDLYSYLFQNQNSKIQKNLIAGFLSAIDIFGKEALSSTGNIDRIKHGEYTIIIRKHKSFKFGYSFIGQSYLAIKKLEKFIEEIVISSEIWINLIKSENYGQVITDQNINDLNTMANLIFAKQSLT